MENEKWKWCRDPEEMSPEERWAEIVELLAKAVVRLTQRRLEAGEAAETTELADGADTLESTVIGNKIIVQIPKSQKGQAPFGKRNAGGGIHEAYPQEASWMEKIEQWAKEGLSLKKMMEKLNTEDHETRYAGKWNRARVWWVLKRAKERR